MDAEFAPETLKGDVRDFLLTHMRAMETPWSKLNEKQQRDKINACESAALELVAKSTAVIAAHEFPKINVSVGKYAGKDGTLKAEISCAATDDNLLAMNGAGRAVLVLADPEVFRGEKAPAVPEADQRALELGREYLDEPSGLDEPAGDENDDITEMPAVPEEPTAKKGRVAEHAN